MDSFYLAPNEIYAMVLSWQQTDKRLQSVVYVRGVVVSFTPTLNILDVTGDGNLMLMPRE